MMKKETIESFINAINIRAMAYAYFFDEIAGELNPGRAYEISSRVTYRLGSEIARNFSHEARESALQCAKEFIADPAARVVFRQKVISGNENAAVIEIKWCPLVNVWQAMGLEKEKIHILCSIAHRIDSGTIEGAGFMLDFLNRIACGNESCILRIFRRKNGNTPANSV